MRLVQHILVDMIAAVSWKDRDSGNSGIVLAADNNSSPDLHSGPEDSWRGTADVLDVLEIPNFELS